MGFKNACFISYRQGLGPGNQRFYEVFREQLANQLDFYLPNLPVYLDTERVHGGDFFNSDLARALCNSVCMVSLFIPTYFDLQHTYCAREYRAMLQLEAQRLPLLPQEDWRGLIIPIVLRGSPPEVVSNGRKYYEPKTLQPNDWRKQESLKILEQVAGDIYRRFQAFQSAGADPCSQCVGFEFPSEDSIRPWLTGITAPAQKLPNR